jgi:hypothetical protein
MVNSIIDHNKIHAADVLHACYYLTTQPVPGFAQNDINLKGINLKLYCIQRWYSEI